MNKGMVTNYWEGGGGYKTGVGWGGGGMWSFTPYEKGGGAKKVLAMLKGGTKSVGVVFSHIELERGGGVQKVTTL